MLVVVPLQAARESYPFDNADRACLFTLGIAMTPHRQPLLVPSARRRRQVQTPSSSTDTVKRILQDETASPSVEHRDVADPSGPIRLWRCVRLDWTSEGHLTEILVVTLSRDDPHVPPGHKKRPTVNHPYIPESKAVVIGVAPAL